MNMLSKRNRWEPFQMMEELQNELNQVFSRPRKGDGAQGAFQPEIAIREEKDKYVLKAETPGMKKEDFKITVEGSRVILSGEKKEERQEKQEGLQYSEITYGSFMRSFDLPVDIQADKVKAVYKEGVLTVEFPKSENARQKQIQVNVA